MTSCKEIAVVCLGTVVLLLAAGCRPSAKSDPKAPDSGEIVPFDPRNMQLFYTLNIDQSTTLLKNNPDTVVVDVRTADEFAEGHLPGALNFDVGFEGFRQEIETLDRGATILVYGSGRNTKTIRLADSALSRMKGLGFRDICRMTGGIEAWEEAGQPFVRDLP